MERRKTRSAAYQHLMAEIYCSNDMMSAFSNSDSISARLNPFEYNEELIDLEDELKKEFWRIVDTLLTPRQRDVIRLYADGYTQTEIAKILNINQSSITKNWNGNSQYYNDDNDLGNRNKKSYGGSKRKIKKIIETDEKIVDILRRMNDIRENKW